MFFPPFVLILWQFPWLWSPGGHYGFCPGELHCKAPHIRFDSPTGCAAIDGDTGTFQVPRAVPASAAVVLAGRRRIAALSPAHVRWLRNSLLLFLRRMTAAWLRRGLAHAQ